MEGVPNPYHKDTSAGKLFHSAFILSSDDRDSFGSNLCDRIEGTFC